jgi:putative hemolysin
MQSASAIVLRDIQPAKKNRYTVALARNASEIEEAQRLRYQVFFDEMGATSSSARLTNNGGLDVDEYDAHCEHLLVRDNATGQVVGCYRIMRPETARQRGAFYSDGEFDLTRLNHLRSSTAEVGRACIHPDFRSGSVIMLLWSGLAQFMLKNRYDYLIGCASINLADGHENAITVYREMMSHHFAPAEYRVFPLHPYAIDVSRIAEPIAPARVPPLLKGYARLGAWICGAPAWDPDFNTADLFVLLPISRLPVTYTKHFMGTIDNLAAAA